MNLTKRTELHRVSRDLILPWHAALAPILQLQQAEQHWLHDFDFEQGVWKVYRSLDQRRSRSLMIVAGIRGESGRGLRF